MRSTTIYRRGQVVVVTIPARLAFRISWPLRSASSNVRSPRSTQTISPLSSKGSARSSVFSRLVGYGGDGVRLRRLEPSDGHETDFDPLIQRLRNALQHEERVPLVIGVLQAADRRGGGANALGTFAL